MDSLWTWIVFAILILALIGFLVFTFFRDRYKNKKIIEKRIELRLATIRTSKELAIRIYTLIEMNEKFLKMVEPGRSKIKMKNVTLTCKNFLKKIYNSKAFKVIYIESDEADEEYSRYLNNLIQINSNLWHKNCLLEIEYFKKLHDELKDDNKFEELKIESQKMIEEYFKQEVDKNNEYTK